MHIRYRSSAMWLAGNWEAGGRITPTAPTRPTSAMWLAGNWEAVRRTTPNSGDPVALQRIHGKQQEASILPEDLAAVEVTQETEPMPCGSPRPPKRGHGVAFGDMDRHDRADAMWLVSVCDRHTPLNLSHPSRIRRRVNDQKATSILPADLSAGRELGRYRRLRQQGGDSPYLDSQGVQRPQGLMPCGSRLTVAVTRPMI